MSSQVTVIGGGLAGITAAVAAVHAGADVALIGRTPGATALSPGGVDLAPTRPSPSLGRAVPAFDAGGALLPRPTLAENLEWLLESEPTHPLAAARVTLADVCRATQFLREHLLGAPLAWKGLDRPPYLLPTETGTVREMDLPPAASEGGDLSDPGIVALLRVGVVGLAELPSFDPSFLAGALGSRLGAPDRFVPLLPAPLFGDGRPLHPVAIARAIEEEQGERLVAGLADLVHGLGLTHLMLPPVIGLNGSPGLLASIREATGLVAFEALAVSSPCPGLRLLQALHDMADAFGVRRLLGQVVGFDLDEEASLVRSLLVSLPGGASTLVPCSEVILASGGLYGGGIEWGEKAVEALFGLPVVAGPGLAGHEQPCHRPLPLSLAPDPSTQQAAFGAGLHVDPELRPTGEGGDPELVNLRACGGVLCGHDPGARRGGTGVALLTGWRAGLAAAADPGEDG